MAGKHKAPFIGAMVFSLAILSGCTPGGAPSPLMTDTPSPTEPLYPSPTPVWFPPTHTPTPFPTPEVTPTPELRQGIGRIILEDDFSNGGPWQLGRIEGGSAALGKNELTIAINAPRVYVSSIRNEPVLDDFYLEITANPTLCKGLDHYGILFRVASASDFYRLAFSCDGQVRFERVIGGTAMVREPWSYTGVIPPGAPSISRLGVWVQGREFRVFVNDIYLLTLSDPSLSSGTLGLFARSTGDNALTVNFTNLILREIEE